MALAEQAKRVAAEFDFGDDAVNKAVEEFRREMGMWRNVTETGQLVADDAQTRGWRKRALK
jgi:hexokinase